MTRLYISRGTYDWMVQCCRQWLDANWESKCNRQWMVHGVIVTADPDTIASLSKLLRR